MFHLFERISHCLDSLAQLNILTRQFSNAVIEFRQLVIPVEGIGILAAERPVIVQAAQHPVYRINVINNQEEHEEQDHEKSYCNSHCSRDDTPVETPFEGLRIFPQLIVNGRIQNSYI